MRLEATKTQASRRPILWISLLLTVGLVYWQWSTEQNAEDAVIVPDASLATPRRATEHTQATTIPQPALAGSDVKDVKVALAQPDAAAADTTTRMRRALPATKVSHALFAAHEWLPPPPKPQPPPPPQAPPVPYTYVGSMEDLPDGHTVILMQQKKVLMPKVGGQVSAQWRLDKEDAQSVYFTYLPLNQAIALSKSKTAGNQRQSLAEAQPEENIPLEQ